MGKKVIRLTEADLQKIVQKVLSEQPLNDNLVLEQLNDRIQSFIYEKQREILNQNLFVRINWTDGAAYIVITDKDGKEIYKNNFTAVLDRRNGGINRFEPIIINRDFTLGILPLSDYYDEIIGDNNNFKTLISLHPEIKAQFDKMKIRVDLLRYDTPVGSSAEAQLVPKPSFYLDLANNNRTNRNKYKGKDSYVKWGESFPMGEFFNKKQFATRLDRRSLGILGNGYLQLILGSVGILHFGDKGENVPNTGDTSSFAEGKVKLDLVDMFDYDTINFKDETKFNQALSVFNEKLNNGLTDLKGLKDWLEKQNLIVYGYASQDADPEESVQGKYGPCKGYGSGLRKEYNVCLSNARAEKVASELQKVFDDAGVQVTIKHQGAGETTKFSDGNGWSDKQKDTEEQLSPNRRVLFNIPKYTEVIRN